MTETWEAHSENSCIVAHVIEELVRDEGLQLWLDVSSGLPLVDSRRVVQPCKHSIEDPQICTSSGFTALCTLPSPMTILMPANAQLGSAWHIRILSTCDWDWKQGLIAWFHFIAWSFLPFRYFAISGGLEFSGHDILMCCSFLQDLS